MSPSPQPAKVTCARKDQQPVAVTYEVVHVSLNDHPALQEIWSHAELSETLIGDVEGGVVMSTRSTVMCGIDELVMPSLNSTVDIV